MESKELRGSQGLNKGCPLDRTLRLLAGEWTIHILWALSTNGPTRHGKLRRDVGAISSKVLTDRLRMLESEGMLHRAYEPTVPPKVTYSLTARGAKLDRVMREIDKFAFEWDKSTVSD